MGSRVVLVEGYCILHDEFVSGILDRVVWVELDESTCCKRREHWPDGWLSKEEYFDSCVWPAHRRYESDVFCNAPGKASRTRSIPQILRVCGTSPQHQSIDTLTNSIRGWLTEQDVLHGCGCS